ncbi:MAG: hypothetical protein R2827_07875 [Bdellovibrionales bacterium]
MNLITGIESITDAADNVLRTDHVVLLKGSVKTSPYVIQGVSIFDSYGKSLSDVITIEIK